jgi:hypothetical protein
MTLIEQTKLVLEESNKCLSRHQEMRDTDSTPDFFSQVKPHADHWHAFLIEWREQSRIWLDDKRPRRSKLSTNMSSNHFIKTQGKRDLLSRSNQRVTRCKHI